MKKSGILHAQLCKAIAEARHGDAIVILDAGMPVPTGCNFIDLGIVKGVPSFSTVLKALLNDMIVERYEAFDLMPQYNPELYTSLSKLLSRQEGGLADKEKFQQVMLTAKAVIRTGEFGSCCNLILYSASGRDSYVEKYDITPQDEEK